MHPVLGRLRGRGAPPEDVLDRLLAECPTFRLHWAPSYDGRWSWIVGNRIATPLYQATGRHIYDRFQQWERDTGMVAPLAEIAGAEMMMDGDYLVKRFTEEEFGGDGMLEEIRSIGARLRELDDQERDKLALQRKKNEWRFAQTEAQKNAAFSEYVEALRRADPRWFEENEALAKESFRFYLRGARSFSAAGAPTEVTV